MSDKAVILVSGGLDSSTVLAIAAKQGYQCYTLSFDYGQRHRSELDAAVRVSESMSVVEHKVIKLDLKSIGGSALTDVDNSGTGARNDRYSGNLCARQKYRLFINCSWAGLK